MTGLGCLGVDHSVGRYGKGIPEGIPSAGGLGVPPSFKNPPRLGDIGSCTRLFQQSRKLFAIIRGRDGMPSMFALRMSLHLFPVTRKRQTS